LCPRNTGLVHREAAVQVGRKHGDVVARRWQRIVRVRAGVTADKLQETVLAHADGVVAGAGRIAGIELELGASGDEARPAELLRVGSPEPAEELERTVTRIGTHRAAGMTRGTHETQQPRRQDGDNKP